MAIRTMSGSSSRRKFVGTPGDRVDGAMDDRQVEPSSEDALGLSSAVVGRVLQGDPVAVDRRDRFVVDRPARPDGSPRLNRGVR